jgi:hypothetical protein
VRAKPHNDIQDDDATIKGKVMQRWLFTALAVVLAVTGCSGSKSSGTSGGTTTQAGSSGAALTNSSDFPMYQGATVIASKDFSQNVDASSIKMAGGALSQGSGTYAGHEIIAKTGASLDDLANWLTDEQKTPPQGFTVPSGGSQIATAREQAKKYGIDFAPFVKDENGKKYGYIVIAMDPATLNDKLGAAIVMIERFRSLPDAMKGPIDAQLKSRVGISGSEALDPASPLGAALAGYDDVKSTNARAIVIVDATKQ